MATKVPVYVSEGGVPRIYIYEETEEGLFRRTPTEILREMRDNIVDISTMKGELYTSRFDRQKRVWSTPTVRPYEGRPQSYYEFLRGMAKQRRFFVVTTPSMANRISKFSLHELVMKPAISLQILSIFGRRYLEALDVDKEKPPEQPAEPEEPTKTPEEGGEGQPGE